MEKQRTPIGHVSDTGAETVAPGVTVIPFPLERRQNGMQLAASERCSACVMLRAFGLLRPNQAP